MPNNSVASGALRLYFLGVFTSILAFIIGGGLVLVLSKPRPKVLGAAVETSGSFCAAVKLYRSPSWEPLNALDMENIKERDSLFLASVPVGANKLYDRARFRVQTDKIYTDWQETTDTNAWGEFYVQYSIPVGIRNTAIEVELRRIKDGVWQ